MEPSKTRTLYQAVDYRLVVHRYLAHLRAWKALGVPIEATWGVLNPKSVYGNRQGITLRCTVCGMEDYRYYHDNELTFSTFATILQVRVHDVVIRFQKDGCPHLVRILEEEPAELAAIEELELLSGGA